jgi:diamine N-acetyltransferase
MREPLTLRDITAENREAVLNVRRGPGQDQFVASVEKSFEDAETYPQANPWHRAIYVGDEPVGFVMLSWDVEPMPGILGPWFLWRLLIDERYQGRGYGREAMRQVTDLIRANGATELLTSYVPGEGGPAGFYRKLGFEPTGEMEDGEVVLRLRLSRSPCGTPRTSGPARPQQEL